MAGIPAPLPTTISTRLSGMIAFTNWPAEKVPSSATATEAPPSYVPPNGVNEREATLAIGSAAFTDRKIFTVPPPRDMAATMSSRPLASTSPQATSVPPEYADPNGNVR